MFFFTKNSDIDFKPDSIEYAYFLLLNDDLVQAQKIFKKQETVAV